MFLRKEQSGPPWAGHGVSGFESSEPFLEGMGGRQRKETALVCENKSVPADRLDEGTGLENREEALICGSHCYITHLQ